MPLIAGTRLGLYEIVAPLGAGGMGEVYRARDTKLHRSVAIKVLPDSFASDPDRLARFEREARVLASLNHPHIAHLYGLETQDARAFIVMELVEGETLAEWIVRQPRSAPPMNEVISIARQMADALEVAHEQGIVHRDLKPANVKVADDGTVKVLDFGLARARGAADGLASGEHGMNSPTLTTPADMTRAGVVLGTAAYMSPEQAKGRAVDKRADIWAYGCVLFEMLTGRPAFSGETLTETLASVIRDTPPLDALPSATPPYLRTLVARCLERDPKRRLRDIGEARLVLEQPPAASERPAERERVRGVFWRAALPWALALAAIVALVIVTAGRLTMNVPPSVSKIAVPMPNAFFDLTRPVIALSPDGQRLAFVAEHGQTSAIYLRAVDGFDASPLAGTEDARSIFFSPDGEWIGFFAPGRIKKVSTRGGPPVTVAAVNDYMGATWTRAGTIVATNGGPSLLVVPENGGEARAIQPTSGRAHERALPHALPDGQTVLYTIGALGSPSSVAALRLESDTETVLVPDATNPAYFDGHLIFARSGTLFAVRFDPARLEIMGTPVPVLQGVLFNQAFLTTQYAISTEGRLAYIPAPVSQARQVATMDRSGAVSLASDMRGGVYMPRVAPDGRRVAMTVRNEDAYSISLVDLMTGAVSELVAQGLAAVWSPDGQRIAFAMVRPNGGLSLQIVPADRSSPPRSVLDDRSVNVPTSWSPDGRSIAFTRVEQGSPTGEDIYLIAPDGSGLRPAVPIAGNQHAGTFSPDGRWLAYVDAGNSSIFVSEVANFTRRWRADIDGGSSPGWSPDGRELFFLGGRQRDQLFTVAVTAKGNTLELAKPAPITPVSMGTSIGFGLRRYDVTPDGKRFVFATADASTPTEIRIMLDFRSQLTAPLSR